LKQVLLNLVGNAVKFTEAGRVDVSVTLMATTAPPGDRLCLCFSVRDTGIGIRQDQVARLFEPFTQADHSTTRKYGGSGLGLTISRDLVALMGGEMKVESRPGEGSIFSFTAVLEPGSTDEANFSHARKRIPSNVPPCRASGKIFRTARVLLVDDNEVNRLIAGELLEEAGLTVDMAASGQEAVESVRAGSYDMVFMDIQMSEMDGYEATRQIRQFQSSVPIVALTAKAMAGERERCLDAGMSDFVSKPVVPEDLYNVVTRWISGREDDTVSDGFRSGTVPDGHQGLPCLDAVDANLGLQRTNGNLELYRRVLSVFVENHYKSALEIQEQLAQGGMERAADTAHALKGAAGGIGAVFLFKLAAELEYALRKGDSGVAPGIPELQEELDRVLTDIDELGKWNGESESAASGEPSEASPEEVKQLIDQLSIALETRNTIAGTRLLALREALGNGEWAGMLSDLQRHVANFDFNDAEKVLARIADAIGCGNEE
jgi:CheY-like chemotaxis protein